MVYNAFPMGASRGPVTLRCREERYSPNGRFLVFLSAAESRFPVPRICRLESKGQCVHTDNVVMRDFLF